MAYLEEQLELWFIYIEANLEIIISGLVFMCVFLLIFAVIQHFSFRIKIRQRTNRLALDPLLQSHVSQAQHNSTSLSHQKLSQDAEILFSVEHDLSKIGDQKVSNIRHELIKAGFFSLSAVYWFYAICIMLALSMSIGFLYASSFSETLSPILKFAICICLILLAFILPKIYLDRRQVYLKQECWRGFPDFMDLMVVSAEAGITPRASIERISRELAHSYPYLGANLFYIGLELQAGKPLYEAIENFARRVGFEEILSLGSLLQQTEELGTSLTNALRIYSDEMRDKRVAYAEEKPMRYLLSLYYH